MGTGITILLVFIAVVVTLLIAVPVTRKIAVDNKIKQYDSIQRKDSQINGCAYKMGNIVCVGISACFRYIVRCNDCAINICYG